MVRCGYRDVQAGAEHWVVEPDAFNWAYKGFQYPIPPTWRRAVRLEDQLQWLLQALMCLNNHALSYGDISDAIDSAIADILDSVKKELEAIKGELEDIQEGRGVTRNPVNGQRSYIYVALKQMYDILRVKAMTWDEADALGYTWDQMDALGHSWYEMDMMGNVLFGDGANRVKYTPTSHIGANTPGYVDTAFSPGDYALARTWGDLAEFGFVTEKR